MPQAVFEGEVLISPLPTVKFGHKIRKEPEIIKQAFLRFSFDTVIEAMNNKKIVLNL